MNAVASFIGYCFVIAVLLGSFTSLDFHVYFGVDAAAWHAKHAKKESP